MLGHEVAITNTLAIPECIGSGTGHDQILLAIAIEISHLGLKSAGAYARILVHRHRERHEPITDIEVICHLSTVGCIAIGIDARRDECHFVEALLCESKVHVGMAASRNFIRI